MSASLRQWCAAALAAVVLAAVVAPWVGTGTVAAQSSGGSFADSVVYEQTGDVANVTVETDAPGTVHVGTDNGAFVLRVKVDKGTTKLRVDTYKAGDADRYALSEMVWAAEGTVRSRTLLSDPIDGPLDPAQYDMNVTIDGVERDLATLWVQERTTDDVSARIAPKTAKVSNLSSGADVRRVSVPPWNDSVARGDWLLVNVTATGVKGYLEGKGSPDKSRLDSDVMRVEFVQTNPPLNGQPNEFAGDSVERVFTHPDEEGFQLVVDTADHDIAPGDRYRVSFVIPEESPLADGEQNVSTEIRVVEREVNVERDAGNDAMVVDGETRISGTTTLTPGTTINVTARDPGVQPLFEPREVEVTDDRTFAATFDFSDLEPDREFEFRLRDQNRVIPAVVAGATTTTPEPTTTESTTQPTTTPPTTAPTTTEPAPTTTTPPPTDTTTATTADGFTQRAENPTNRVFTQQAVRGEAAPGGDGFVPGFGPTPAVLALVAALALAVRRL